MQSTMAFLHLFIRLPGVPIRLLLFKKEFQICSRGWRIVFDEDNRIASRTLDQAPKVVRALGGIAGQNASFAPHLAEQGLERTDFMVLGSNRRLRQDHAALHLVHMPDLLLWLFSSIGLLAGAQPRFAIHGHMDSSLA